MRYLHTEEAVFLSRPNRFIAEVELAGQRETVHVKNTGRCRELLIPGRRVMLERSENPGRKTRYDLISVEKPGLGWVNLDSQAPNRLVGEWLAGEENPFPGFTVHPEYTYGQSRIDFFLEKEKEKLLMEVKGCTLERERVGYFPDAPTERGVKHLKELAAAVEQGYTCYIIFVIAMPGVTRVLPSRETHPAFGTALDEARAAGVKVLLLCCDVTPDSLNVTKWRAE